MSPISSTLASYMMAVPWGTLHFPLLWDPSIPTLSHTVSSPTSPDIFHPSIVYNGRALAAPHPATGHFRCRQILATHGLLQTINGLFEARAWLWVSLLDFWKRLILTLELVSCFLLVAPPLKAPEWSSVTSWTNLLDHIVRSEGITWSTTNEPTRYVPFASVFYSLLSLYFSSKKKGQAVRASNNGHAIDLFGGCLDQVGLLEMRSLPNSTNGIVGLSDSFTTAIFKQSFLRVFNKDDQGHLSLVSMRHSTRMFKSVFFFTFNETLAYYFCWKEVRLRRKDRNWYRATSMEG